MGLKDSFLSTNKRLEQLEINLLRAVREVKNLQISFQEQKEQHECLLNEVKDILQTQRSISLAFQDSVKDINKITMELAVFKPSMQQTILDKTTTILEQELANATNKIFAELSGFSSAKESFKDVVKQVKSVEFELVRLQTIAKTIGEQDVSLERYAKELEKNDRQKLELMKRVDDLERLLAKIKRDQ
jgi:hypothetical protein